MAQSATVKCLEDKMDKFIHSQPEPAAQERELLYHLIEECAEIQHRATKILRFGWNEVQQGQP